jgi:hypothetical protein
LAFFSFVNVDNTSYLNYCLWLFSAIHIICISIFCSSNWKYLRILHILIMIVMVKVLDLIYYASKDSYTLLYLKFVFNIFEDCASMWLAYFYNLVDAIKLFLALLGFELRVASALILKPDSQSFFFLLQLFFQTGSPIFAWGWPGQQSPTYTSHGARVIVRNTASGPILCF